MRRGARLLRGPAGARGYRSPLLLPLALFAGLGLGASALIAVGTTRYVDDNTCPATGAGTLANPYCRIQDAICIAAAGDTVSVAPGTYLEAVRMKPGVSLVSQGGPSQTTINAANQPCTDNTYCAKRTGSQCSVVTFASGHTTATRIEGFTITGGAGLPQVSASLNHVAGGGIYVFSSPSIVNNVITNNVLAGTNRDFKGAGIYVAVGNPVITGNTITSNRAIPGPGTSTAVTYGYGGGIWIGFNTGPVVSNNIIQGNRAGDPNTAYSLGGGGGLVVWPGDANHPGPVIDRNLIADNETDSLGGGVSLNSLPNTSALAVVTNNVIVGNRSDKNGGGVYIYFNKSSVINNTISDNWAFLGGGIYSGQNEINNLLPVKITNNIIEGNHLYAFGTGGGIYSLDLTPSFDPEIRNNDLWNNDRNNTGGELTDPNVIGSNGNFSANPRFHDKPGRDFHVDPNSPVIDVGTSVGAPPVDRDSHPRGQDGNGVPNNPVTGDFDVGAYEFSGACLPAPEVCDNLDNDCNLLVDDGLGSTTCGVGQCQVTVANCVGGATQTCTPGSPTTEVCDSLDNNCNGATDENLGSTTCGVGQCQRTVANCVGGATQTCTPGSPTTEVCDSLDNNCNGATDEGFANTDGDLMADCVDPDDDNDGVADASDCAPLSAGSFGAPSEVANLEVAGGSPTVLSFDPQNIGSATRYEVVVGLLSRLRAAGFQEDFCGASAVSGGQWTDNRPGPPPGDGWFYEVRSANACGLGTLGSAAADAAGAGDVCATGVIDQDGDGSPSDLDCNDANASLSPINVEVCDGLDNTCDQVADEGNPGGGASCGTSVGECSFGVTACSGGSLTCTGGVGPALEICDGLDNDCTGTADDNLPDFDGDTLSDCVDPDDDNDGSADGGDCAPLNSGVWGVPVEVPDLDVQGASTAMVVWQDQPLGPATLYDVATGEIAASGGVSFASGACLGAAVSASPVTDARSGPPADRAWYYLVKSRNACGAGTYGTPARDTLPSCP